jgi:hypothetical protein
MKKPNRWTVIVALLFVGALVAPLVGLPNQTLMEVWGGFNYISGDYLHLNLVGPEETTVGSPQIAYTFTVNNINPDMEAATNIELVATSSGSMAWETSGTPCVAVSTKTTTLEKLETAQHPGEVLSIMWELLRTAQDGQPVTAESTTSGSTVLYCELSSLESGDSHILTVGATPTETGTQTITGFVTCDEAEANIENNIAAMRTEVTPHLAYLPIIIR